MNRIDTYTRAIRNDFRWEKIRSVAWMEGYCLLGSVFTLTPSGKFYTPFANSNVWGCKRCKSTGSVSNRRASGEKYNALDAACTVLLHRLWETEGMAANWSAESKARMAAARAERDQYRASFMCSWCSGTGSHEAAQDADWHAALERVAKQFGLFVGGPDGADDCDIFVAHPGALERMESGEDEE